MSFASNKNLTFLLITGIILFIISFLCLVVSEPEIDLPLDNYISLVPLWGLLIFTIIIAPVIEEFAFRSWQKKTDKRKWIAPVLFIIYAMSVQSYFIAGFAILVVLIYGLYYKRINSIYVIMATSIVFAAIHLPQDYTSKDFYFYLFGFIGIAFILSFFRLRYGLVYSMIFHALWNFTALFLVSYSAFYFSPKTFDLSSSQDSIILTRHSIFDHENAGSSLGPKKIDIAYGNKQSIIDHFLPNTEDRIVVYETNPFTHYKLQVKPMTDSSISKSAVFSKLLSVLKLKFDTSVAVKQGYDITGDKIVANDSLTNNWISTSVKGFATLLQGRYAIPFISNDTAWVKVTFNSELSIKSQLADLEKRYGFKFKKIKRKMQIITVQDESIPSF